MNIFIGSSSEAKKLMLKIAGIVEDCGHKPIRWNQNPSPFRAGEFTLESLDEMAERENIGAAIFICTSDDKIWFKNKKVGKPRDNVIFEHGLFMGKLGRTKSIIIKSGNLRLPTDLSGVTYIDFSEEKEVDGETKLIDWLKSLPVEAPHHMAQEKDVVPWQRYMDNIRTLCTKLNHSPRQNGFRFDAIVGIARGGIIAADLVNRRFMAYVPLLCLWGDYGRYQPQITFQTEKAKTNDTIIEALDNDRFKNILIVDDITRKASTITAAADFIRNRFPDKTVKTAVLFVPEQFSDKVDYYAEAITDDKIAMPYSVLD